MIGTTVSHYRVLERIGAGGMGEVYLAEDLRLGRKIALKLLPEELTRDPDRRNRFVQEARAAAALEHPHIAVVHDIEEVDGRTFIAMEYVRGESLRSALQGRKVDFAAALDLAIQIAEALAHVHERHLVHRDLKPENVLVTDEGYAKIIDFGLAKLTEPDSGWGAAGGSESETVTRVRTRQGQLMGTVAYMSPEQVRGEPIDGRSDVFSFGVLLYEMLSGASPFHRGSVAETVSAILRDMPRPLRLAELRTAPALQRILDKTLAKKPADRYQSARDLALDLRAVRDDLALARRGARWWRLAALAVLAVALASGLGFWLSHRGTPSAVVGREALTLLVADFDNRTGDPVFEGALEQALGLGLEGAPFLGAYGRPGARRVAARVDAGSGGRLDERVARLVCRSEGIAVAVLGSVASSPSGYLVEARVIDVVSGEPIARGSRSARSKPAVVEAVSRLAADLRSQLGDKQPASGREIAAETFTTASLEAMGRYARAQELQYAGRDAEAMTQYREAIALDPGMGRAYSGLAVLLANNGEPDEAERQFQKGLAFVDRMTERERGRTLGAYYLARRDPRAAIQEFERLIARYPADTAGHANLALAFFLTRDMERALKEGRQAVALSPRNVPQRNNLAFYAMYAGDFETALQEADEALAMNPSFEKALVARALAEIGLGRAEQARATYRRLEGVSALGASMAMMGLADLALYEGRPSEAVPLLERAAEVDRAAGNMSAYARKLAALAEAQQQRGRMREAVAQAEGALGSSRDVSVVYATGIVFLAAGRNERVRAGVATLAAEIAPDSRAYANLLEAEIRMRRGRPLEAVPLLEEARELADTWLGRLAFARAHLAAGAFPQAYSELQLCVKRRGEATAAFLDDIPTCRYLPPVYLSLGRTQEGLHSPAAAESYRTLLAMQPGESQLAQEARERLASLR
jgi:eukaryotic-like serine/threonine-protein kinase